MTPESAGPLPTWRMIAKRVVPIVVFGVTMYVLAPVLAKVASAWPRLSSLQPWWVAVGVAAEAGSFACTYMLKRIALRTKAIFAVVTSGLVGNAVTNVFPGGDATGATIEFRLLSTAGVDAGAAVGGLTATALLQTGSLLALPVLTLPAIAAGAPISRGLAHLAYLGLAVVAVYAVALYVIFRTDGLLHLVGRLVEKLHNSFLHRRPPITGLPTRLVAQRDATRAALGQQWGRALIYTVGRVLLDFGCLLAMLAAVRTGPVPWVVLIAYASTAVLALLPVTPGGLGIVEGSLTGLLVLAGIPAAKAVLSTLAYRLASYWLPTLCGPLAFLAYRRRFRHLGPDGGADRSVAASGSGPPGPEGRPPEQEREPPARGRPTGPRPQTPSA
jgi:uncharacterized protein (TIRG00374 family)